MRPNRPGRGPRNSSPRPGRPRPRCPRAREPRADRRLARGLRAHEVGRGGRLVGDRDHGRAPSRPAASGRPRQSSSGARPGAADRDLGLAVAPGAAEGVGDHDRRDAERGAQRAPEPSGVARQQDHASRAAGVGLVHAGVRAHEAVAGAADQPPRSARTSSADSSRTARRGAGPCRARRPAARAAGARRPRARTTPLGLRDHLVGDDEHVAGAEAGPPRGGAASSAARSSPGRTSGQPGQRADAQLAHAAARRASMRAAPRGARRGAAAAPRRAAPRGRPACRRRARATAAGHAHRRAPAAAASAAWRANEPGPNAGAITVGGRAAARSCPSRGGRGRSRRRAPRAASSPSTSAGSSAGQSPGTSSTRPAPRSTPPATPREAARAVPGLDGVVDTTSTP